LLHEHVSLKDLFPLILRFIREQAIFDNDSFISLRHECLVFCIALVFVKPPVSAKNVFEDLSQSRDNFKKKNAKHIMQFILGRLQGIAS
jgi:hypothetical protein